MGINKDISLLKKQKENLLTAKSALINKPNLAGL
jgi:hypothetical protein